MDFQVGDVVEFTPQDAFWAFHPTETRYLKPGERVSVEQLNPFPPVYLEPHVGYRSFTGVIHCIPSRHLTFIDRPGASSLICTCSIATLMASGCQCGATERERA
jgi:hypothetical protein